MTPWARGQGGQSSFTPIVLPEPRIRVHSRSFAVPLGRGVTFALWCQVKRWLPLLKMEYKQSRLLSA